jgi:hypothetical protein
MLNSFFTYTVTTERFTNRKWRKREFELVTQADSTFECRAWYVVATVPIKVLIGDLMSAFLPIEPSPGFLPWMVFPPLPLGPGSTLAGSIELGEGVRLGRSRPNVQLVFMGSKVWEQ